MNARARKFLYWVVAATAAAQASSCGLKPTAPDEEVYRLPVIVPKQDHPEILSTPERKVSLTANEIVFRHVLGTRILQKFYAGDFAEIERLATLYRTGMVTGSGIETLGPLYWSFTEDMIVDKDGVDKRAPGLTAAWIEQFPKSPTPYIATAFMYEEVARRMESSGDAPATVESKQRFRDEALGILTRNWEIVKADPYAHGMKLRLISSGARSDESWEEAFDKAKSAHKSRFTIYFDAVNSAPDINDSTMNAAAGAEKIANALASTMGADGDIGYARVWWSASNNHYVMLLFEHRMVNWPRIRDGFFKMINAYPDPWNVNSFARFSCIVGDAKTLLILAPAIRQYPIDDVWPHDYREYCLLSAEAQTEMIPAEPQ